jgi:hypothetical protein
MYTEFCLMMIISKKKGFKSLGEEGPTGMGNPAK